MEYLWLSQCRPRWNRQLARLIIDYETKKKTWKRAIATGPVSPVSTDHFFPHSWLAWHCQLAPLLGGHPHNALKLARWLRTVQQNCSASLSKTFRSYKRMISRASFTCKGCGFRLISKLDRKANTIGVRCNGQNDIHVKLCRLSSEKHHIGPKLVSEAIS